MSLLIPDVSLIVPVYNDEKYLSKCLLSILNQVGVSLEIIVIDDGSTDDSFNIAKTISVQDNRLKVYSYKNAGLSVARNRGVDKAEGKYIQFVDSDDMLPENSITHILKIMEDDKLDLYCGSGLVIDENDELIENITYYSRDSSEIMTGRTLFNSSISKKFIASACLYVFKREAIEEVRFYPGIYHEDNLFTVQLYLNSKVKRAVHSMHIIYLRRIRAGSITQVKVTDKHCDGYYRVAQELYKELLSGKYDDATCKNVMYLHQKMLGKVMQYFHYLSFRKSASMFLCVFKSMPLKSNYFRAHLKNFYYFTAHNCICKRAMLMLNNKSSLFRISK